MKIKHKSRLKKKANRGFKGYPIATVAFYGPEDKCATNMKGVRFVVFMDAAILTSAVRSLPDLIAQRKIH